jgi:hypothetical protein
MDKRLGGRRALVVSAYRDLQATAEQVLRRASVGEVRRTEFIGDASWCFSTQSLDLVIVDESSVAGAARF